jgi:hypothetical protein
VSTIFENMTKEENDFLERMKTAPQEQIDSFRIALNQLMQCYGENVTCSILPTFLNRETGELQTSGINLRPEEMLSVAQMALTVIEQNFQPPGETAH